MTNIFQEYITIEEFYTVIVTDDEETKTRYDKYLPQAIKYASLRINNLTNNQIELITFIKLTAIQVRLVKQASILLTQHYLTYGMQFLRGSVSFSGGATNISTSNPEDPDYVPPLVVEALKNAGLFNFYPRTKLNLNNPIDPFFHNGQYQPAYPGAPGVDGKTIGFNGTNLLQAIGLYDQITEKYYTTNQIIQSGGKTVVDDKTINFNSKNELQAIGLYIPGSYYIYSGNLIYKDISANRELSKGNNTDITNILLTGVSATFLQTNTIDNDTIYRDSTTLKWKAKQGGSGSVTVDDKTINLNDKKELQSIGFYDSVSKLYSTADKILTDIDDNLKTSDNNAKNIAINIGNIKGNVTNIEKNTTNITTNIADIKLKVDLTDVTYLNEKTIDNDTIYQDSGTKKFKAKQGSVSTNQIIYNKYTIKANSYSEDKHNCYFLIPADLLTLLKNKKVVNINFYINVTVEDPPVEGLIKGKGAIPLNIVSWLNFDNVGDSNAITAINNENLQLPDKFNPDVHFNAIFEKDTENFFNLFVSLVTFKDIETNMLILDVLSIQ